MSKNAELRQNCQVSLTLDGVNTTLRAVDTTLSAQRAVPQPAAILELLKPVTWFPPIWAFSCGLIASGISIREHWPTVITGLLVAGPLVCGGSQAVNDWFDRHVDAINEPKRPIPSGRIPGQWGLYIAILWTLLAIAVASTLGTWGLAATALGVAAAWAYSMPPVRLKLNGWWGNLAVGLSYEGLAWVTGASILMTSPAPGAKSLLLALLYSIAAHGIMTLNDFKAIAGDTQMGVRSLPVQLGAERAAWVASLVMLIPQYIVAGLLGAWGKPVHGLWIIALILGQTVMMHRFTAKPVERALWMSALGVPLEVAGMMISAFAIRGMAV